MILPRETNPLGCGDLIAQLLDQVVHDREVEHWNHNGNPTPGNRPKPWLRVLYPILTWTVVVLGLVAYLAHRRWIERTRITFTVQLDHQPAGGETIARLDERPVKSGDRVSVGRHRLTILHPKAESLASSFFVWYGVDYLPVGLEIQIPAGATNLFRTNRVNQLYAEARDTARASLPTDDPERALEAKTQEQERRKQAEQLVAEQRKRAEQQAEEQPKQVAEGDAQRRAERLALAKRTLDNSVKGFPYNWRFDDHELTVAQPLIQVVISPSGEVVLKVKGAKGGSCQQLTAGLERALGTPAKRQLTQEFYEQVPAQSATRKVTQ